MGRETTKAMKVACFISRPDSKETLQEEDATHWHVVITAFVVALSPVHSVWKSNTFPFSFASTQLRRLDSVHYQH